jgi:hypothetical protein
MVRFAHGRDASIGFHTIPTYADGRYTHPVSQLGLAVGHGGCVHSTDADAAFLYRWAPVGTTVVVLRWSRLDGAGQDRAGLGGTRPPGRSPGSEIVI